jgi:hypothetical protein
VSKYIFLVGLILLLASTAFANNNCRQNSAGKIVCAPLGGTITTDKNNEVVCGLGSCVITITGMILCSSQPGGTATIIDKGITLCSGDLPP